MLAVNVHRFGGPEVLVVEEVPRPLPGEDEVLVRVLAAGVGPWDAWVRSGTSKVAQTLPLIPGSDIAGRVETVGPGVRGFAVGDDVYGVTNERFTGGYAQFASASAFGLARRPRKLTAVEAASVPVVAVTAQQMLFDHGGLQRDQRVLVHGAGGNVGAYALQLAKACGATVVGTDRGPAVAYARSLAVGQVLDSASEDFASSGPFDVVIDTVGGAELQRRSLGVLRPGGRLISSVAPPDEEAARASGVQGRFMLVHVTGPALARLAELLDAGALVTRVGAILPLAEAARAHEMLEGRQPRPPGKIVLRVAEA